MEAKKRVVADSNDAGCSIEKTKKMRTNSIESFFTKSSNPETNNSDNVGAEESSETPSQSKKTLIFKQSWVKKYGDWLIYNDKQNKMYCSLCKNYGYTNTMAMGTANLKTSTIVRHIEHRDHQRALIAPRESENMKKAVNKALTTEENAILVCFKAVHWLCQENIPLSKYHSLMTFLQSVNTPNITSLQLTDKINYSSYDTALDILQAISDTTDKQITEKMKASPVCTILTDESTDIKVHHKLVINCRIVDPITLSPSTLFLTDVRITSASGKGIFDAIAQHLAKRHMTPKQVTGLGTDGASVMTGRKEGLTGQFLKHNPHIINSHCSAHRVALVSEQSANSVPSMKEYQKTVVNLYYHFKKSPAKLDKMEAIQKVLEDPCIKYREIHSVRWLSFYNSVEAIYRTMDSLLTYLTESSAKDAVASGLKKKIANDFFISMTYHLLDILKPIMKLNLFFQKKDVDIGNVKPAVDTCIRNLKAAMVIDDGSFTDSDQNADMMGTPTFGRQLINDLVDGRFKGNHIIPKSKFSIKVCVRDFCQAMLDNIERRFPDQELMSAFCVLGMKPVPQLSNEPIEVLESWGNESIQHLISQFGAEQKHSYGDKTNKVTCKSDPMINPTETMEEWKVAKDVVVIQKYPTNSTAKLWELLATHHREQLPNLITLAALALAHPVHTSDCERSFSSQNQITTPLRNRLNAEHCDQLMRVSIEGKRVDLLSCLSEWRKQKTRLIFNKQSVTK